MGICKHLLLYNKKNDRAGVFLCPGWEIANAAPNINYDFKQIH